jgi:hypothetical protein
VTVASFLGTGEQQALSRLPLEKCSSTARQVLLSSGLRQPHPVHLHDSPFWQHCPRTCRPHHRKEDSLAHSHFYPPFHSATLTHPDFISNLFNRDCARKPASQRSRPHRVVRHGSLGAPDIHRGLATLLATFHRAQLSAKIDRHGSLISMFSEEDRLASFATTSSTTTSTAKKRQSTKTAAASSSTLQWPHPVSGRSAKSSGIPTPPLLAKNGFYYAPTQDAPDMVSHFLYPDVQIANWQPSDNPLLRLEEALPGNGWCRIFRSEQQALFDEASGKWTWQVSDLLPTSKEMVQARKETFGSLWPYDGKKGWKPTSKKLAEAGFFFTPTEEEPDNATCIYCGKALGGWEKADDPVHEHQRRHPECAFFNCELREPPQQEAESAQKPTVEDRAATANADGAEEIASKKGGKRAVSTATRKASHKVSKAKSSTLAISDEGQTPAEHDNTSATKPEVATIQDPTENIGTEEPKGARKTRSVSTRKTAARSQIAEAIAEPVDADAETEPPAAEAQEPVKTLKTKKSAVGLGNGNRVAATARPSRAASRRATKAIGLLSADDDVDRIPRGP